MSTLATPAKPNLATLLSRPVVAPRGWTRDDALRAVASLGRLIQERFFWFLLATLSAAACCPGPGLWLAGVSFGEVSLWGERAALSLPTLMLAYLLFSAGLGVRTAELRHLLRDPKSLLAGLAANLVVPVVFLAGASLVTGRWLRADQAPWSSARG
jgi:BASS family bile acid:Na+ symporter